MGAVSQLPSRHNVQVRRKFAENHRQHGILERQQGTVERFNRTLAGRLFGYQLAKEMLEVGQGRSVEWVARLPAVVAALNNEVTRLTGKKSANARTNR